MQFPTALFSLFFLAAWLAWAPLRRSPVARNILLLAASLVFVNQAGLPSLSFIIYAMAVGFFFDAAFSRRTSIGQTLGLPSLWTALSLALAPLAWTKYGYFLASSIGLAEVLPDGALYSGPIPGGVSFITFSLCAWIVASWSGKLPAAKWHQKALSVSFFPSAMSGPVLTPASWSNFSDPQAIRPDFGAASSLFSVGFFLKMVCASRLGEWAAPVFADPAAVSSVDMLFALHAYAGQLYADFAGYTLMALGAAKAFGVDLPHNFAAPYFSASVPEFWRRWHLSLSHFWRDHIYFPLGGNRKGFLRELANLCAVMLLCGLWHGAGWLFLIWGALHGVAMCAQRLFSKFGLRLPRLLAWALCLEFVVLAWIPFRSESLDAAWAICRVLWHSDTGAVDLASRLAPWAVLLLIGAEHAWRDALLEKARGLWRSHPVVYTILLVESLLLALQLSPAGIPSFIYFNF